MKIREISTHRKSVELGGITLGNGAVIATDVESQSKITGAQVGATLNPSIVINWKNSDGSWSTLSATEIQGIATAVVNHVQTCFTKERAMTEIVNQLSSIVDVSNFDVRVQWELA